MPESDDLTVIVGRFDSLVGSGVSDALSRDQRVRILAGDVHDAALEDAVARQAPRVVIVDDTLEYALLARLLVRQPTTGVLVLAHAPVRLYGTLLLAAGATCLPWAASHAQLLAAVRVVARGEPTFFGADGRRVAQHSVDRLLTQRETEVFERLSHGDSYKQIAAALHIAPETVRKHTVRICRKLNVESRFQLIGMSLPGRLVTVV